MTQVQGRSAGKRVLGTVLMLLGLALLGYGTHYLTRNGTCSSTGYAEFGPVPKCNGPEALYITSVFFLGPALALVGWMMAQLWGWLWPGVCVGVGVGLATIDLDPHAAPGAKATGLLAGFFFFALAVLSVILTTRKRLAKKSAPAGPPIPGPSLGPDVGSGVGPSLGAPGADAATIVADRPPLQAGSGPTSDPLDKIAKLAQLRDSGALTEEEFEREKAKLLAQM